MDAAWWRPVTERAEAGTRHPVHVVSAMRLVTASARWPRWGCCAGPGPCLDPAVPLRATIVGEGPQRRLMERYLRTHRLDWVELPGRVDKEELRRLHQGADVYLTAARLEAFGIAPLEARAAGVPVVAPRGTGVDDFVEDGVDGLLADSDGALAAALARLAGDDALRARMRAHLLATPPAQDWSGVLAATLAEYRRAGVLVA